MTVAIYRRVITPEEINGDLEWEVEHIVKGEIFSYTHKGRGQNK